MSTIGELARELVSIPSHEDETAAGDVLEAWLRAETDATVVRDDAGNVFAAKGPAGAAPVDDADLALVGHHDVVPPDETQVDDGEYVVEERNGRLYGRGAADMKGALAAAAVAFRDADPAGELVVSSFVGEEVGGVGARRAIEDGFAPDYAVVGEGSTDYSGPDVTDVVVAHKGRRASTVTAAGAAAHASEPEAGENAIYRATEAVATLRELEVPSVTVDDDHLAGSLVVTEIEGGTAWNVVPETCELTVDERTVPGGRTALERVEELPGVSVTVDQEIPPMRCADRAFAEAALEAADAAQPGRPAHVSKPHVTDASWLADAGTECLVVGPSEPGEAHTADESVSLAVLERCYRIYRDLAESWPP